MKEEIRNVMGGIQKADVVALLKDESLIQDLAKALVEDTEAAESVAEDIADKLGDTIEDEP